MHGNRFGGQGAAVFSQAGLQALDCGIPQGYPDYMLYQMVTVMRGGQEVTRFEGYPGADKFFGVLRAMLDEARSRG